MCTLWDKIPKVNRESRFFQQRIKKLQDFILRGPITTSQRNVREVLGVHNVTLEKDMQSPEFKKWYAENIQPYIDRKKKELILKVRADLENLDLQELRKYE